MKAPYKTCLQIVNDENRGEKKEVCRLNIQSHQ